jgi:hypothetical protein
MQLLPRSASDPNSIWLYNPSFALAIVAAILYFMPAYAQLYLTVLQRNGRRHRYFLCPLVGATMEVAGYAVRAVSTKKQANIVRLSYISKQMLRRLKKC